jgi:hypothetical protein
MVHVRNLAKGRIIRPRIDWSGGVVRSSRDIGNSNTRELTRKFQNVALMEE